CGSRPAVSWLSGRRMFVLRTSDGIPRMFVLRTLGWRTSTWRVQGRWKRFSAEHGGRAASTTVYCRTPSRRRDRETAAMTDIVASDAGHRVYQFTVLTREAVGCAGHENQIPPHARDGPQRW